MIQLSVGRNYLRNLELGRDHVSYLSEYVNLSRRGSRRVPFLLWAWAAIISRATSQLVHRASAAAPKEAYHDAAGKDSERNDLRTWFRSGNIMIGSREGITAVQSSSGTKHQEIVSHICFSKRPRGPTMDLFYWSQVRWFGVHPLDQTLCQASLVGTLYLYQEKNHARTRPFA